MNRDTALLPALAILFTGVAAIVVVIGAYATADRAPEPGPAPTPILTDTEMVDLLSMFEVTPTPSPTPSPRPTIRPPSGAGPERVVVAAPLPVDVAYADWYIVTLAFAPADQYRALRTSWCESGFVDDERGEAGEVGRFQIMPLWLAEPGVQDIIESWFPGATGSEATAIVALQHEHVNAQVAAWILENNGDGWGPWTTRFGCEGWQG